MLRNLGVRGKLCVASKTIDKYNIKYFGGQTSSTWTYDKTFFLSFFLSFSFPFYCILGGQFEGKSSYKMICNHSVESAVESRTSPGLKMSCTRIIVQVEFVLVMIYSAMCCIILSYRFSFISGYMGRTFCYSSICFFLRGTRLLRWRASSHTNIRKDE